MGGGEGGRRRWWEEAKVRGGRRWEEAKVGEAVCTNISDIENTFREVAPLYFILATSLLLSSSDISEQKIRGHGERKYPRNHNLKHQRKLDLRYESFEYVFFGKVLTPIRNTCI